jgi:ankyrin repeat protein
VRNFLNELGFNINIKDVKGKTCLHYASFYEDITLVEYFLRYGADTSLEDSSSHIPEWYIDNMLEALSGQELEEEGKKIKTKLPIKRLSDIKELFSCNKR